MTEVSQKLSKLNNRTQILCDTLWSKIINRKKKNGVITITPKLFIADKNDTPNGLKFKESWTKFCDSSTLDGLYLIGGTKKAAYIKISASIFLACTLLAGYLCYDNLNLYLDYKPRTTISYNINTALSFPALTFCNVNNIKRSMASRHEFFIAAFTYLYARNESDVPIIMKENKMTCRAYNNSKNNFWQYARILINNKDEPDYKPFFQTFNQIAKDMVKKCWWNKNEIDCNKQFVNHFLDFLNCFTFNQNSSDLDTTGSVVPVFGMEGIPYISKTVFNAQQGLKLLLDTQQQEYCGSPILRSGAGFRLLIHDTHAQTSLKLLPAILLSPGFEYTITVQPVTFDMRNFSESRGRCISNLFNPMRPESDYDQPSCFQKCFAEKMWKYCKCVPIQTRLITDTLIKYAAEISPSTRIRACDLFQQKDVFCSLNILSHFQSSSPNEFCPNCIRKCFETKYEYKISMKRLSRSQLVDNGTSSSKRDLVIATFNFDSMTSIRIVETQLFTLLDLFIYWGNILGLFLGFSFVTLYEVFHQLIYSIHILCKSKKCSLNFVTIMKLFRRCNKLKKRKRIHQQTMLFAVR